MNLDLERTRPRLGHRRMITLVLAFATVASGLVSLPVGAQETPTIRLMTHDSFFLPEEVLASFEDRYGARVAVFQAGDAGSMVNQAILTADRPLADVLYGIDNTFLSRALEADIFEPYRSAGLDDVPAALILDARNRVTPINRADVCLNVDVAGLAERGLAAPTDLMDLTDPAYRGTLVVEDPSTSSPGLAFLLATVATFGEGDDDGWRAYWSALRDNDVAIASGWEEAYYGIYSGGAGAGDRPIVVSYATSPAAEVVFGPDPEADISPTAAVAAGCFGQVEFAGILSGTEQPELARALIDHLLSDAVQAELPLSMFVYPARLGVDLPAVFERHALLPESPLTLDPAAIDAGRERWIREWTDTVLR
jgi:thiamine transport system substrate-binding protein